MPSHTKGAQRAQPIPDSQIIRRLGGRSAVREARKAPLGLGLSIVEELVCGMRGFYFEVSIPIPIAAGWDGDNPSGSRQCSESDRSWGLLAIGWRLLRMGD